MAQRTDDADSSATEAPSQDPITLPDNPDNQQPNNMDVIVIHRGTLYIALVGFIVLIGLIIGWGIATFSGITVNRAGSSSSSTSTPTRQQASSRFDLDALMRQINPPGGYVIPATFGTLGPHLLDAGAIDYERFVALHDQSGNPLTDTQRAILTTPSDDLVRIDSNNAHFLLNFLWAVGLTNNNPILTRGAMTQFGTNQIDRFASTGGWTLGKKPAWNLYASLALIKLSEEQQARLENVASGVYRPCCQNPTIFPDCNHGMAMLGLLELMASQNATEDEMFTAAKYVNAFWFPQQSLELAVFFQMNKGISFAEADPRLVVGVDRFSAEGFNKVHQWLTTNNLLPQPGTRVSCGVR